ncbi:prohibitin family protein [Candidatus Woesebacteria bacterium]|nr:prohibitin family protein [Candidatus Woesebacteria bacterium]
MKQQISFGLIRNVLAIIFVLAILVGLNPVGIINPGERGVKVRLGKIINILDEGLYVRIPLIERVHVINVKTRTITYDNKLRTGDETEQSSLFAASKDLQDVQIAVVVNYRIDPKAVGNIFSQYGLTYEADIIEPIIRETVKSIASQYTAEELVTKRLDFSEKVNSRLADRLKTRQALLERFSVTNLQFSTTFTEAIEKKATAEQEALAAKNKLAQVKYEAEQQVARATAEAESIKIQSEAIQAQGGANYVQLKAIEKWDGKLPTQFIPGQTVPFLNLK